MLEWRMQLEWAGRAFQRLKRSQYTGLIELFVSWRLGLLFLFYLAIAIVNTTGQVPAGRSLVDAHFWWDGFYYFNIARYGYAGAVNFYGGSIVVLGFFPLFPILVRLVSYLTFGHVQPAALLTNTALVIAFMVYLYKLLLLDFEETIAFRTVFFVLMFPTALFLAVNYSEPVFMMTLTASVYYARKENWPLAGIFGMLCALSRHIGAVMLPVLAWEYLRQRGWSWKRSSWSLKKIGWEAWSLALVPLGSFFYMAYLWASYGDPLYFFKSHEETFQHGFSLQFWLPVGRALKLIWQRPLMDAARSITTLNLLILVVFVVLFVYGLKRLNSTYSFLLIIFILAILMTDSPTFPLVSLDRYVLPLFPAFLLLAQLGAKKAYEYAYLAFSGVLLGAMALIFSLGKFFTA